MPTHTLDTRQRAVFERELVPVQDSLYRTALRLARDRTSAEDLVQDAVLKAYRFFASFEEGTNFRAWLHRVLYTVFINGTREKSPRATTLESGPEPVGDSGDAEVDLATHRQRVRAVLDASDDRIKAALEELPLDLRTVFFLSTVEGLKYREIADIMDCPIGTVMSRLFRARRLLQEKLTDYAADAGYPIPDREEESAP